MNIRRDSFLILGTGELGMAVLRHLSTRVDPSSGITLSVLLRPTAIDSENVDKKRDLSLIRDLGVDIVSGHLAADSPTTLTALFKDFHTIVGCTGFVAGSGTQRKIARAVLDAGVPRYVPWQFGVDYDVIGRGSAQDLFNEQLEVRDLLRAQRRTGWIIISTGMFISFLFEPSFGVVDVAQNTVHALGSWETVVTVTSSDNVGAMTAEILLADPPILNQVVYTAGETISYARLADVVDSVLTRKVQRVEWSVPWLKDELARDPDNPTKKYRVVFAEGKGVAWNLDQTFNARRDIKMTGVAQWVRDNLK